MDLAETTRPVLHPLVEQLLADERLAAFADASAGSEEPTPTRRVKAPRRIKPSPEAGSRVDRILEKLSSVDAYLTEVNTGKRAVGRKKD